LYAQTIAKEAASVSIGICATTELANTLSLTDQMLSIQDPRMNLTQVIVATPNRQLARELESRGPRMVVLLEGKREGKTAALNKIITRATSEILVMASADIKLAQTAIPRLVNGLVENQDWGAVDSRVELANKDEYLMDKVSMVLWGIHNGTLDELDGNNRLGHVAGDLLAVRRCLVEQLPDVINDDAYLALRVQEKGFRVKRVRDAAVWIAGPRTPTDYVRQRSRILRGHLQLIQQFGKMPTTFEFQFFRKPRRSLGILVKTVAKLGPMHLLGFFTAGLLELLSLQMAIISSATRPNRPWPLALTTKQAESFEGILSSAFRTLPGDEGTGDA
jgi:cellulose synthase/poly-beta-1,6-N-acetylglucosamine synthase-like glycosyltransferase